MHRSNGRRAKPTRVSKRVFLVLVRTELEAQYVHFIKRRLDQPVQLYLTERGLTAAELIVEAQRLDRVGRRGGGNIADEVWCFVDSSEAADLLDPPQRIRLAVSSPSFEYWLLTHFSSSIPANTREMQQNLDTHLPALSIALSEDALEPLSGRYLQARSRAIESSGGITHPATIHQFVDSLRNSMFQYRGDETSTIGL